MTSTDLTIVVENWLNSGVAVLRLEIDKGAVALVRHSCGVACRAAIPLSAPLDEHMLEQALQLAEAARHQFHDETAMLSMSPQDEQLWLWMRHEPDDAFRLCRSLETLLNQRDAWLGLLSPAIRTAAAVPLNLNTLVFLQGEQHA
ncbi:type III secretion protein [Brenneria roseae subsp. americana]|uniref:Type III secretion protein n=1 Tax=Brenneria roseae subsp. americana TaxID=1508507 RepID=A0A2U1TTR2_9GAMM|nr:type III secretion system chaperone [Brenneria roseae]PWC12797.1 type III secretion protein [Brenneria roseae subsp. americana]